MPVLDSVTTDFIARAIALPPADLALAFDRTVDLRTEGGKEASLAASVSAAQNSSIDRTVREALRARLEELSAHREYLLSEAIAACGTASRAVCKRAKLTDEQYRVLVDPFVTVGMDVPPRDA
ncbi:hypothetical protein AB0I28_37570 [Phytomonospora sp. NPDC050363]|uniref:hypothetical protein n=1 Tax=Phytomonospora sp. NPDC050363 TaxID=3155642 RepID=UPI0033F1AD26